MKSVNDSTETKQYLEISLTISKELNQKLMSEAKRLGLHKRQEVIRSLLANCLNSKA